MILGMRFTQTAFDGRITEEKSDEAVHKKADATDRIRLFLW